MAALELDPKEWRECYAAYVAYFKTSNKSVSDEVMLTIRLKRLGFEGVRLNEEIRHIKENT